MDRAALDAAIEAGLETGGFVSKGRLAEDGRVPGSYPVEEAGFPEYRVRTELNVLNSDATLILNRGEPEGGTLYTLEACRRNNKPVLVIDIDKTAGNKAVEEILNFISGETPSVLNVAGPRESKCQGIYGAAKKILLEVFNPNSRYQ